MNAFRGLAMGEVADFHPWVSIMSLLACGVVGFGLALYLFSWDSHNTVRRGHPALAFLVLAPLVLTLFFWAAPLPARPPAKRTKKFTSWALNSTQLARAEFLLLG